MVQTKYYSVKSRNVPAVKPCDHDWGINWREALFPDNPIKQCAKCKIVSPLDKYEDRVIIDNTIEWLKALRGEKLSILSITEDRETARKVNQEIQFYNTRIEILCSITDNRQNKNTVIEPPAIGKNCSITDNRQNKNTVIEQNKNTVIEHLPTSKSSITENPSTLIKPRKRRVSVIEQGSGSIGTYSKRDRSYYRYSYRDDLGKLHHKHLGPTDSNKTKSTVSIIRLAIKQGIGWKKILSDYVDF